MTRMYALLFLLITNYPHFSRTEGFAPDTLVRQKNQHTPIERLTIGDTVEGNDGTAKTVVAITTVLADQYLIIQFTDSIVTVDYTQQFYSVTNGWIQANEIMPGELLIDSNGYYHIVDQVTEIHEPTTLISITVDDHLFCIAPYDLLVHNMAAPLSAVTMISLGTICITNPVAVTIGVTLALSVVAKKAYAEWNHRTHTSHTCVPESVRYAERIYYELRCKELDRLKNELSSIKKGLQTIKALCDPASHSFTSLLLNQPVAQHPPCVHPLLTITQEKESHLTSEQKTALRRARQQDLLAREHELIDLQVLLAIHSNTLLERVEKLCAEYKSEFAGTNGMFNQFLQNRLELKGISSLYRQLVEQNYTATQLSKIAQEALLVSNFYQSLARTNTCITTGTTIVQQWQKIHKTIQNHSSYLQNELSSVSYYLSKLEEFTQKRVSARTANGLKAAITCAITQRFNTRATDSITAAMHKRDSVTKEAKQKAQEPTQVEDNDKQENDDDQDDADDDCKEDTDSESEDSKKEQDDNTATTTVDELIKESVPGEEKQYCKQFVKPGGYEEALKDFDKLKPQQVKEIKNSKTTGKTGTLRDGRRVNARQDSSDKRPTLEIQPPKNTEGQSIKFRYGEKP